MAPGHRRQGRRRARRARRVDPRPARLRPLAAPPAGIARPAERLRGRRGRGLGIVRRGDAARARRRRRGRRRARGIGRRDGEGGVGRHHRRTRGRRDRSRRSALGRFPRRSLGRRIGGSGGEPAAAADRRSARAGLQGLHHQVRRSRQRRGPVRAGGIAAAARLSRQAVAEPLQRRRPARQPAATAADGAAEPVVGVRPRGRRARRRPPVARRHRPAAAAVVQAREGDGLPRHGGDDADRQFRLDARPADHGRGDLRRHPRPHARTLRRQGRDPRLHHPRLEGRAGARSVAAGGQAGQPRPAQRPAPPHLQGRRRAVAARAQEPRPDDARGPAEGEHRRRGARLGLQAPARPHRAAAHPDDDLRRRAGRRFDPVGQRRQLPRTPSALRDRGDRERARRSS